MDKKKSQDISRMLARSASDSEEDSLVFEDAEDDHAKGQLRAQPSIFTRTVADAEAPIISKAPKSPISEDAKSSGVNTLHSQHPETSKTVLTIEHAMAPSPPRSAAFFLGMSKPVFAIISFALLCTITSSLFFFTEFLKIPGLQNQIEDLTEQVDRLEGQVEELQIEVDRLSSEVDRLELGVDSLELENDRLASENNRMEVENDAFTELYQKLNGTTAEFYEALLSLSNTSDNLLLQVTGLSIEAESLRNSTGFLEMKVSDLQEQADILNTTNYELNRTNQILETQNDELETNLVTLNETNNALGEQIYNLTSTVSELEQQTSELNQQVARLESVISFLNGTTNNGDFEELIQTLNNLIEQNRNLELQSLKTQYMTRIDGWLCDYLTDFAGKFFVIDPNVTIGETEYASVISNINSGAMTPLCLDVYNFEDFVNVNFMGSGAGLTPPYNASTNQLRSAVAQYTSQALNYYFPDEDEVGISSLNWTEAGYECDGFPSELKFTVTFS